MTEVEGGWESSEKCMKCLEWQRHLAQCMLYIKGRTEIVHQSGQPLYIVDGHVGGTATVEISVWRSEHTVHKRTKMIRKEIIVSCL